MLPCVSGSTCILKSINASYRPSRTQNRSTVIRLLSVRMDWQARSGPSSRRRFRTASVFGEFRAESAGGAAVFCRVSLQFPFEEAALTDWNLSEASGLRWAVTSLFMLSAIFAVGRGPCVEVR